MSRCGFFPVSSSGSLRFWVPVDQTRRRKIQTLITVAIMIRSECEHRLWCMTYSIMLRELIALWILKSGEHIAYEKNLPHLGEDRYFKTTLLLKIQTPHCSRFSLSEMCMCIPWCQTIDVLPCWNYKVGYDACTCTCCYKFNLQLNCKNLGTPWFFISCANVYVNNCLWYSTRHARANSPVSVVRRSGSCGAITPPIMER